METQNLEKTTPKNVISENSEKAKKLIAKKEGIEKAPESALKDAPKKNKLERRAEKKKKEAQKTKDKVLTEKNIKNSGEKVKERELMYIYSEDTESSLDKKTFRRNARSKNKAYQKELSKLQKNKDSKEYNKVAKEYNAWMKETYTKPKLIELISIEGGEKKKKIKK